MLVFAQIKISQEYTSKILSNVFFIFHEMVFFFHRDVNSIWMGNLKQFVHSFWPIAIKHNYSIHTYNQFTLTAKLIIQVFLYYYNCIKIIYVEPITVFINQNCSSLGLCYINSVLLIIFSPVLLNFHLVFFFQMCGA